MLDVRTLVLATATCSTALVAALWFGSRGERRDGMEAFLRAVTLQTAAGFVIGARAKLSYAVGLALGNAVVALALSHYVQALFELRGRKPLSWRWHAGPAAAMAVAMLLLEPFEPVRLVGVNTALGAVLCWLAFDSARLPAVPRSSTRLVLAAGFGVMAAVNAARAVAALGLFGPPLRMNSVGTFATSTVLVYLAGLIAVSVGFLMVQKERSESALEGLRDSLEGRVQGQVEQLVAHAREVERLNGELRQQVRERTEALTRALARIAQRRKGAGIETGTVLGGRFELGSLLGSGGMGAVYRAKDRATGEPVAVKVISATSADELDAMRRFLREARASASVTHPGVVYARHVDVSHGRLYLVFELVEGAPLSEVLARVRTLAHGPAALLGARVAEALAAAHEHGVLHRDVKPANVMLASRGAPSVRLLDFGIARLRDAVHDEVTRTRGGALLGTPAYMAPEQALDARNATDRSDVYALGAMLFEALAGRLPFEGREAGRQIVARLTTDPPPLARVAPEVPAALALCVDRCLRRAPEGRPAARELAEELESLARTLGATDEALGALVAPAEPA